MNDISALTAPAGSLICAAYSEERADGPAAGPCVMRPDHQGRIHQDVRGVQWATRTPLAGGILQDFPTVGETVPGCYLPPRTPRRADEVRDAISRAFDIPTTHTADPPEQDTFAGHQLEHGEQSFIIVTRYQKALRLLAEAYVEQEQLLLQVQGLSGELVAARGQARAWQEKHLELAERCTVAVCGASAVAGGGGA